MTPQERIDKMYAMRKRRANKAKVAFGSVVPAYRDEVPPSTPNVRRGGNRRRSELFLGRD